MVKPDWNGYNVMHDTASRVAALDVGFLPSARAGDAPPAKFVYLLGSDDWKEEDIPADAFVVYQVGLAAIKLAGVTAAHAAHVLILTSNIAGCDAGCHAGFNMLLSVRNTLQQGARPCPACCLTVLR